MKSQGDALRPGITQAEVSWLVGLVPVNELLPEPSTLVASPVTGTPPTQEQTATTALTKGTDALMPTEMLPRGKRPFFLGAAGIPSG